MPLTTDWFEENSQRLKILALIILLVIVLLIIIISFARHAKNASPRPSLSNRKSLSNSKRQIREFDAGTTACGKNWEYTINQHRCQHVLENQFNQVAAESGKKFLIVDLTFKNRTNEVIHVTPRLFDFKVHTASDTFKEYQDSYVLEAMEDYYGHIGDISPGESVIGNIIFEIPDYTSEITLEIGCDDLTCKLELK